VSRQRGHGTRGYRSSAQPATDAEAAATVFAIRGLRSRLKRHGNLTSPAVLRELRKLEEQIAAQLREDPPKPGRHRSRHSKAPAQQIADAAGFDLKPDPLAARTTEEFITTLKQYRAWNGDPPWRQMASQAGQAVVHSTMHAAMNGSALPKLEVVKAIVIGCGGDEEDVRAFVTARSRLDPGGTARRRPADPDFLAAPVTPLSLVPAG